MDWRFLFCKQVYKQCRLDYKSFINTLELRPLWYFCKRAGGRVSAGTS